MTGQFSIFFLVIQTFSEELDDIFQEDGSWHKGEVSWHTDPGFFMLTGAGLAELETMHVA